MEQLLISPSSSELWPRLGCGGSLSYSPHAYTGDYGAPVKLLLGLFELGLHFKGVGAPSKAFGVGITYWYKHAEMI